MVFYMRNILFIVSVVVTFFMSLCYQFKWYLSIFLTVIFSVVSGISELIVMNLVTFTGVNFTIANSNFFVYIVGLLATKTFT